MACPCCRYKTIAADFDICPICFWENDPWQVNHPDATGANSISLREAQANFKRIGASSQAALQHVRKPLPTEAPDP
ncbi:MAG TPA: CPCC family cysteine-rich protein [Planctomycetota bacterium]|nr:CPCC family cysteine-rich protein [Planctomycetota bacterium]